MFGPNPEAEKHANRKHGLMYNGGDGRKLARRSNFLEGRSKMSFGHEQNGSVIGGINLEDETHWPTTWAPASTLMRVPRTVILSCFPNWTLMWEQATWNFPNNVFERNKNGDLTNYYYFEMWDGPSYDGRYNRIVGSHASPYFAYYQDMRNAFDEAKIRLEKRGYHVVIPDWLPRDGILPKALPKIGTDERANPERDSPPDFSNLQDSCYVAYDKAWIGYRPDVQEPSNHMGWATKFAPLVAPHPYFGSNTLHLYCGHPNSNITLKPTMEGWEFTPFTPEGNWLAGVYMTLGYTGAPLEFFDGRRNAIREYGWGWGGDDYEYYKSLSVENTVNSYKTNFWKYRDLHTHLFSFPEPQWDFGWNPSAIYADQEWCHNVRFYFGFEYEEFCSTFYGDAVDIECYRDRSEEFDLKVLEERGRSPSTESIENGLVEAGYIIQRIENYYRNIEPTTLDFYNRMKEDFTLPNVEVSDESDFLMDAGAIVEYVEEHFANYPS